jgi:glycosyltransferase involved in cell wall biosynthesis
MRFVTRRSQPGKSIHSLLRAHRLLIRIQDSGAHPSRFESAIEKMIAREFSEKGRAHMHLRSNEGATPEDILFFVNRGAIVLKSPRSIHGRSVEKGVLLLKYTSGFHSLLKCINPDVILQDYRLVLEPAWTGYANRSILSFTRFREHPIVVMAPEPRDFQFLKRLGTNLIPVSLGPGDWVNPSVFHPINGAEKRYDAVFVAKFALYKRHHALLRALCDVRDLSLKVAFVAPPWPPFQKEIQLLIDSYGLAENIAIFGRQSQEGVNAILNQSRVNLLLSIQEGGNRMLFEGFFAGVPALALKRNIGIPKDYFNSQTGKLIDEKDLGSELLYFREHWQEFDPRPWAVEHIAPEVTTAKLNALLKQLALERGEEWTQDMVAKCNCPNPAYYPDESAGAGLPSLKDVVLRYARSDDVRELAEAL